MIKAIGDPTPAELVTVGAEWGCMYTLCILFGIPLGLVLLLVLL